MGPTQTAEPALRPEADFDPIHQARGGTIRHPDKRVRGGPSGTRVVSHCLLCGAAEPRFRFEKHARRFLQCPVCSLMWIDPMPTEDKRREFYEEAYREGGRYTGFAEAHEIRRAISRQRIRALQHLAVSGRLLDVGASTGDFIEAANGAGFRAEGLEVSAVAVEQARARGLAAHHASVESFDPPHPYQAVTAFDLIEHLPDPRRFVRRIREWLTPGGIFALSLPNVSSIYPRLLMRKHWFYYWPDDHLFYYNPSTISRLLEEGGFRIRRVSRAFKTFSLDYTAANLRNFNPTLGNFATAAVNRLPRKLAARTWGMYAGEMFVLAEREPEPEP